MANKQNGVHQYSSDDFDFGSEFDVDFDFDFTPKPPKTHREAIWRVTSSAQKGFTSSIKSPTFIQNIVKNALPKSYGQAWDLADKSAGTLRDLYNDSVREVKPALQDLARTTQKLMPTAEKYAPKAVIEQLKKFTERYGINTQAYGKPGPSGEDIAVADILSKMYRYTADTDAKRSAEGSIKDHLRENIDQDRHVDQIMQLDSIRGSVNQMAAYQRKIEYNFHRKSLELQARTYYVNAELLREQRVQNSANIQHLAAILHNTALPDYVKMKTSEQFMQQTKNKFIGKIGDNLFGRRSGFINDVREAAKKQGSLFISKASRGLRDGLFGVNEIVDRLADEDSSVDKYRAAGHFVGSGAASLLNKALTKLLGERIDADPNGLGAKVRRFGNKLQYGVENAPQHLAGFANTRNSAEDYAQSAMDKINDRFNDVISYKWQRRINNAANKVGNPLLDFGRDTLKRAQSYDTEIREGNLTNLNEPAVFNNQARKSLTEVIPGYLARIHQELRIIRTGDTSADMIQYNYEKNAFDTSRGVKGSVFNRLMPQGARDQTQQDVERVLSMIDPNNSLSAEQRKILGSRFLRDNLNGTVGKAGSLTQYSKTSNYNGSDEERKHAEEFAMLFKAFKATDEDGSKQVEFAQRFGRVGQALPDIRSMVQDYSDSHHRAALEEIGLLTPGSNKVNHQKLLEYQLGNQYTPRATSAGGGRRSLANMSQVMEQPGPVQIIHQPAAATQRGIEVQPIVDGLKDLGKDLMGLDTRPKLSDIHETLKLMQARLEEGILTVPYEQVMSELRRIQGGSGGGRRGILGRMGRGIASAGGLMTVTLGDLIKGSAKLTGKAIRGAGWVGNQVVGGMFNMAGKVAGLGFGAVSSLAGNAYRRQRGFIDIYVGEERKPRMYGRLLQQGNVYFNRDNNKPIRRFADITGTVVKRVDGTDTVVLEENEIADAWQKEGPVRKMIKTLGAVAKGAGKIGGTLFGIATGGIPLVYRAALWGAKKAWDLLDMAQDVYVKGGDGNPVLLARIMRRGGYRSATTGKAITKPSQIDGPVLVGEGSHEEIALSHDDIRKGLVDSNGRKLRSGIMKLLGLGIDTVGTAFKAARWVGDKVVGAGVGLIKGGWKLGKNILKTGVNVGGAMLDMLRGKPFFEGAYGQAMMASIQINQESNNYLKEIRNILNERLKDPKKHWDDADGDGIRDGSYEDQQKKQKEKDKEKREKEAQQGGVNQAGAAAAGGGMFGGVKSLWNKLRGKKGEDDDSGVSVDINGNPTGRRGPKAPKGKMPKGVWNQMKYFGKGGLGLLKSGGAKAFGIGASLLGVEGLASLAVGAGGMLASGAAAAGELAIAGAAGLAGLISAPVLIGAAAVAAIGIGGYYAYKALTRRKLDLMSRIRYVQYGFSPNDKDHVNAVFGLEDKLKDAIVYDEKGAKVGDKKFDIPKILEDFDIKITDKAAVGKWFNWFNGRFKPVFLTHATALRATVSNKWLSDVDGLEVAFKKKYLEAVRFPDGPYDVTDSPFKDLKSLPCGAGDVKAIIKIAEAELESLAKKGGGEVAVSGKTIAATTAAAAVAAKKAAGPDAVTQKGIKPSVINAAAAGTTNTSGLGDNRGQVTVAGSSVILNTLNANRISPINAVRFKTYGLTKMEADKVRILMALEKEVGKNVEITNKVASWSGSLEAILKNSGPGFGVEVSDEQHAKDWLMWFNRRFLPTFLNYITAVTSQSGKKDYETAVDLLKPIQMTDVATSIYTSVTKTDGSTRSVWTVTESPWIGYELGTDVKIVDPNMQGLKEMSKNAILPESGTKTVNDKSNSPNGKTASVGAPTGFLGKLANWFSGSTSSLVGNTGIGLPRGSGNSATPSSFEGGRVAAPIGKGTGGSMDSIPMPKGNKSWAGVKDTIIAAAQMVGIDPNLAAAMAGIESDFDYMVKSTSSSATGLFQFTRDTWAWMLKNHGLPKYGISLDTPPTDPRANALMGAEYIKLNSATLKKNLGRDLTDIDLYFAHFMGAGGASKFLKSDPNAVAATLFPTEAASNKNLFWNKDGSANTVGQVYQLLNNRLKAKSKKLGITNGSEEMLAPAAGPADKAKDSTPQATPATTPVAAAPTIKTGIGAPTASAPAASVQQKDNTPQKTNDIPLSADMTGFTAAARNLRDVDQQNKVQQELKVMGVDKINETMGKQLETQIGIKNVLDRILEAFNKNSIQTPSAQPAQQQVAPASADRGRSPMRPSPISVSRTMLNN